MEKKSALGRGLGALIDVQPTVQTSGSSSIDEVEISKLVQVNAVLELLRLLV